MIKLLDIDPDNWRFDLEVKEEQKTYVSNRASILARAYAYRSFRSRAFVVFDDYTPVGYGLYHDSPELNAYIFSELFIDARYQGKGYGKEATRLVLDILKADGKYKKVVLCYIEGNKAAKKLYECFGFKENGDCDGDEIIMELTF